MDINYIDAPCGAGKTHQLIEFYRTRIKPSGSRLIISQLTTNLMKATADRFIAEGFSPHVIASENESLSVTSRYKDALLDPQYDLIIITHFAFLANADLPKLNVDTHLFVDEIFAIDKAIRMNLRDNRTILTSNLSASACHIEDYSILTRSPNAPAFSKVINSRHEDDVWELFYELFVGVDSKHYDVFCTNKMWSKFTEDQAGSQFQASAVLKPSIFQSWQNVTIMGANFTHSMMYHAWKEAGVTFTPSPYVTLPTIHSEETGRRANIRYVFDALWTGDFIDKNKPFTALSEEIEAYFEGKEYIYTVNESINVSGLFANGHRAKVMSHGSNAYINFNAAVFLAALNDSPPQLQFLSKVLNISPNLVNDAKMSEVAYQFALRTSLRMPTATTPVDIIVGDKRTADFLHSVLPGSTVGPFDTKIVAETKMPALTRQELDQKKAEVKARYNSILSSFEHSDDIKFGFVATKEEKNADKCHTPWDEFVAFLEGQSSLTVSDKDQAGAITPAGARNDENRFSTVNLIMIDVDKTTVSPSAVNKALPFASVIYSTHSNDVRTGFYRYRIVLPMASAVPSDVAKHITKEIIAGVQASHPSFQSDVKSPLSIYYLPSKAATGRKADTIFIKTGSKTKPFVDPIDFAKAIAQEEINKEWTDKRNAALRATLPTVVATNVNQVIADATTEYQTAPEGQGDTAFFQFVTRLVNRTSLSDIDITAIMHQAAYTRGSSAKSSIDLRMNDLERKITKAREFKNTHKHA